MLARLIRLCSGRFELGRVPGCPIEICEDYDNDNVQPAVGEFENTMDHALEAPRREVHAVITLRFFVVVAAVLAACATENGSGPRPRGAYGTLSVRPSYRLDRR